MARHRPTSKNGQSIKKQNISIRSTDKCALKVPNFKHDTFGKCVITVFGPMAWNCLPKEIRL